MKRILIGAFALILALGLVYTTLNKTNSFAQATGIDNPISKKEVSTQKNVKSSKFNVKSEIKNTLEKIKSENDLILKESSIITSMYKTDNRSNELKKWVLREIADSKYFEDVDLPVGQAVKKAIERVKFESAWLKLAQTQYGITYTDEEVDNFISSGPDLHPTDAQQEYATALGLTLQELNHNYDRFFYIKHVVWKKLSPIIQEKYGLKEFEDQEKEMKDPLHNRIIRQYEAEIRESINKKYTPKVQKVEGGGC